MKAVIATTFIALAATLSAPGSAADHDGHGAMSAQAPAAAQMAEGVVKKVDKSAGKVTVAHGPLPHFNMKAMTMVFRVKEAAWADQLKDGDKIRFMADRINGAYTIVHFERAQ